MTRDEAIAWLRSVGRNASARDWAMGETIMIYAGDPRSHGEITFYPGLIYYLYPSTGGAWNLWDFELPDPAFSYENLESAVRGAHEYVASKEREYSQRKIPK